MHVCIEQLPSGVQYVFPSTGLMDSQNQHTTIALASVLWSAGLAPLRLVSPPGLTPSHRRPLNKMSVLQRHVNPCFIPA